MRKKIVISILAAIIFVFPLQANYIQTTEAAVASKVGSAAAKKLVKEVIKDAAINQAANMAVLEAMEIADKYSAKQGYKVVCPDGKSTCSKPVQVKATLTEDDKRQLGNQVERSLDKKIAGGINATRWGRFIDWFLPLWLITAAGTALDFIINDDEGIKGLINDVAKDALTSLGFIAPVPEKTEETDDPISYEPDIPDETNTPAKSFVRQSYINDGITHYQVFSSPGGNSLKTVTIVLDFLYSRNIVDPELNDSYTFRNGYTNASNGYNVSSPDLYGSIFFIKNGELSYRGNRGSQKDNQLFYNENLISSNNDWLSHKVTDPIINSSTVGRIIYQNINNNFTAKYYMNNGDIIEMKGRVVNTNISSWRNLIDINTTIRGKDAMLTTRYFPPGTSVTIPEFVPQPMEETYMPELDPLDNSKYRTDTGFKIPPIDSVTYKDGITGEPAEIKRNDKGEIIFTRPDGTPINDDDIIVEDGNITENPDGTTTYTPVNPSPENPTREETEIPIEPKPGDNPPGTEDPIPPEEPFPPEPGCDKDIEFPDLEPLTESLSNAFPFSIPWDIQRAFNAAFQELGSEKPEFELDLGVGEVKHTVKITVPAWFDSLKPFTDSFIRFVFAVGIMFGIYRFMKGGGS